MLSKKVLKSVYQVYKKICFTGELTIRGFLIHLQNRSKLSIIQHRNKIRRNSLFARSQTLPHVINKTSIKQKEGSQRDYVAR